MKYGLKKGLNVLKRDSPRASYLTFVALVLKV